MLTLAVAAAAAACEPPPRSLPARAAAAATAPVTPDLCPGGQLCEAAAGACGWRLPAACRAVQRGRYLCRCEVEDVEPARLREFFLSRGATIQRDEVGTTWFSRPLPPTAPGQPVPLAPTLQLRWRDSVRGAATVLAMPGTATSSAAH